MIMKTELNHIVMKTRGFSLWPCLNVPFDESHEMRRICFIMQNANDAFVASKTEILSCTDSWNNDSLQGIS